jgi:hypothetical protein
MLQLIILSAVVLGQENYVPADQRERMRNPDGSCVQCSIAIAGIHHNIPAAEFLLWNSQYGPAVRGGSWPERVEAFCKDRKIPIYNVEGTQTIQWIDWALQTGRYAAVTYGIAHMITAVGISDDGQYYYLVDNNTPSRIDKVSRTKFIWEHRRYGGGWCVILNGPVPAPWVAPSQEEPRIKQYGTMRSDGSIIRHYN